MSSGSTASRVSSTSVKQSKEIGGEDTKEQRRFAPYSQLRLLQRRQSRAICVCTRVRGRSHSGRLDLGTGDAICDCTEAADARLVPGGRRSGSLERRGAHGISNVVDVAG